MNRWQLGLYGGGEGTPGAIRGTRGEELLIACGGRDRLTQTHDMPASRYSTTPECAVTLSYLDVGWNASVLRRIPTKNFAGADLSGHDLSWISFVPYTDFRGAKLKRADLQRSVLHIANLTGASLEGTRIAFTDFADAVGLTPEQVRLAALWQFAIFDGAFVENHSAEMRGHVESGKLGTRVLDGVRLPCRDLSYADLHGVSWRSADLRGGVFRNANLRHVNFYGSDLTDAVLDWADIEWADFRGTKGLSALRIVGTHNWNAGYYDAKMLTDLGLPADHNEILDRLDHLLPKDPEADR